MSHAFDRGSPSPAAATPESGNTRVGRRPLAAFVAARRSCLAWLLLAAAAPAQTALFGSVQPSTLNIYPWGFAGGATSLHVYSASMLRAWGVCAGAQLLDVAVPAGTSGSGVFAAPQAVLSIGHLRVDPPVPGAWTSHLDAPVVAHGPASGPLAFAWTDGAWNSLPGVAAAGFVWDGARDVGVVVSIAPGATGSFLTGTSGGLRHFVPVFAATTEAPVVPYGSAMAARFTFAPGGPCATKALVGVGCYDGAFSFYEPFANLGAFDLAGSASTPRTLLGTRTPSGYRVVDAASAWFPPAGPPVLDNGATPAPMQDDSISGPLALPFAFAFAGGSTTVVHAAANGYVVLGPTSATVDDVPANGGGLISMAPRLAPLWCNLDPALNLSTNPACGVYFDVDPGNQAVYVTWREVAVRSPISVPGTTSVSVQCVLRANGSFEWRYGAITPSPLLAVAGPALVGWSPGNVAGVSSRLPWPIDVSAALPFETTGPDSWRLAIDSSLPILGTTLTLSVGNVQDVAPIAFVAFGDASLPGSDLAAIGAPGCFAYSNCNLPWMSLPIAFGGGVVGTGSTSVALPNVAGLLGMPLTSQALAFTRNNPLGVATSNGLVLQLGR